MKKKIIMLIIASAMGVIISDCGNSREQDKDSEADIKVESSQTETLESESESEMTEEDIDWSENSDPEQSFEVDLGEDGKAWLYTYQGDNESGAHINIVKNGNLVDSTDTSRTWGDNGWIMNTVKAIGFVDYDIDGNNDMVVIGDSSNGEKILIYHHNTEDDTDSYHNIYTINDELGKYVEKNISSCTISEVRKCLMNEYESSVKNWKAAYKHIIHIFDIMGNQLDHKTEYSYDLIDIDGDLIKELVVDNPGYACSLYSYKDGHIICLMDSWGYGAMGNHGYEYIPGKNCLSNYNADFAGLIGKQYYMTIERGKLVTTYWSVTYNFDDKNENGVPDDDETEGDTFEDGVGKTLYYSDYPDLSEDDVKRKTEELSSYTYESLTGTKSKDEIYAIIDGSK